MNAPRKRRDLSREKVVEATLAVMREEGADQITMRRIAQACGTTAMALYHHVPDKAALLSMAVDSLFLDAAQAADDTVPWRVGLTELWCRIRSSLLKTPGAGHIWVRQPILGPGTAMTTEIMFVYLDKGGLREAALVEAADAMVMLTLGSVANELTRPAQVREKLALQPTDSPTPLLDRHVAAYATRNSDERYRLALDWLLDGIDPSSERGSSRRP